MVDWLALVVALVALLYTNRESRRNSSVWLTIEDCVSDGSQSVNENNCQFFHRLTVKVRNHGIPLYGLSAAICFRGADGSGMLSYPIRRKHLASDRDEFGKGMIAEFQLKSYEMSKSELTFLTSLESAKKQSATLNFYSQNYLCASFPVHARTVWLKKAWNRLAWRFNYMLKWRVGKSNQGHDIIWTPTVLPLFTIHLDNLSDFIKSIRRDAEESDPPKTPIASFPRVTS